MNNDLLNKVHNTCLEIMDDIDKVCRENGIKYSLCGGSVIGAKLYNGFIPWDDDIDVMMDRENYNKFLKIYNIKRNKRFNIQNFYTDNLNNISALFTRIIDTESEITELLSGQIEKKSNVFVDITVFDKVKSPLQFKIIELIRHYTYSFFYKRNNLIPGNKIKRIIYKLFCHDISDKKLLNKYKKYDKFVQKNNSKNYKYCSELLGSIFPGRIYNINIFDSYTDILFENRKYMIVLNYDQYLFERYGRTTFTKENKSGAHSHIIKYSRK